MSENNHSNGTLPADTQLGYVHLIVSNLRTSVDFYQHSLGFTLHRQEQDRAYFGAGGTDLLVLTEVPGAVRLPHRTGLYHFAILVPSRLDLARSLHNLIDTETAIQGGADHLVSEAIYLTDPDGNGIEIYRDRPRSQWIYKKNQLQMATDPLDYKGLLSELDVTPERWDDLPPKTRLGHMHLHVAHLQEAQEFYNKVIGFELMLNYGGSAAFLSAGGYHHHLGINTWNGVGVPPPPLDSVGLRYFSIQLPSQNEMEKLATRINSADIFFEQREEGVFVRDPSQNGVLFTT